MHKQWNKKKNYPKCLSKEYPTYIIYRCKYTWAVLLIKTISIIEEIFSFICSISHSRQVSFSLPLVILSYAPVSISRGIQGGMGANFDHVGLLTSLITICCPIWGFFDAILKRVGILTREC